MSASNETPTGATSKCCAAPVVVASNDPTTHYCQACWREVN